MNDKIKDETADGLADLLTNIARDFRNLDVQDAEDIVAASVMLRRLAAEVAALKARNDAAYLVLEGYVDGAPDAGAIARLANEATLKLRPPYYAPTPTADATAGADVVALIDLPEHDACEDAEKAGHATPLQLFIYHEEPAGMRNSELFRRRLRELIRETSARAVSAATKEWREDVGVCSVAKQFCVHTRQADCTEAYLDSLVIAHTAREVAAATKEIEEENSRICTANHQFERDISAATFRAEKAEAALYECYTATGEEAGDAGDFRALVDREKHTVAAVKAMRAELDKAEADLAAKDAACAELCEVISDAQKPGEYPKWLERACDLLAKHAKGTSARASTTSTA